MAEMKGFLRFLILSGILITAGTNSVVGQGQAILAGQDTTTRVITTAVPFLLITPDARSGAMGDAGVALSPDANSVHWNPAKLAFIDTEIGFSVSYTPWLGKIIKDMSISYLSGYYKITREQAVAVSLRYFDLGDIFFTDEFGVDNGQFSPRELGVDATYSRMLSEKFGIGVTARYIHSNLTGNFSSSTVEARPGQSASVDISVYYTKDIITSGKNSTLAFGGVISNIGQKLSYSNEDNNDFIPGNIRLGGAFTTNLDLFNTLTIALDFNKLLVPSPPVFAFNSDGSIATDSNGDPIIRRGRNPDRSLLSGTFGSFGDAPDGFSEEMKEITMSLGLEYWYNDIFAGRAGYFYESEDKGNRKYFTFGVGFRYQLFGVDFAYLVPQQQNNPLAETLRFSLVFNFENLKAENETVTE